MDELQSIQQQCLEYSFLEHQQASISSQQEDSIPNQQLEEIKQAIEKKQQRIQEIERCIQESQEKEKQWFNHCSQILFEMESKVEKWIAW